MFIFVTDAQTHLDNLKNHNVNVNDAQKQLAAAKAALKTDNAKLAAAKTALADAQSKAKAAADTLANAKAALAKINAKLAKDQKALNDAEDALKDDADRYGNGTKIADINVNMGAHNLKPTIANPQISADGQISVPGDASLQTLPFGTTAKWHDANKVAADAMHAGIYQELVDVMFPDGSQKTVAARLAVVDPNAKGTTTPTTPAEPSDQTNANQPANGQAAVKGSTQKSQKASVAVKTMKVRGQQKKTAKKAKKLPQTSDSHESVALAGLGFMLGLGTLLGMRKKRN